MLSIAAWMVASPLYTARMTATFGVTGLGPLPASGRQGQRPLDDPDVLADESLGLPPEDRGVAKEAPHEGGICVTGEEAASHSPMAADHHFTALVRRALL